MNPLTTALAEAQVAEMRRQACRMRWSRAVREQRRRRVRAKAH